MMHIRSNSTDLRRLVWGAGSCFLLSCGLVGRTQAGRPIDPLPAPFYSFDVQSPKVAQGIVGAGDVLELGFPYPIIAADGAAMGMVDPQDEIDALSSDNTSFGPTASFALLFSVDRATVGVADPDPVLVELAVPYNATDQVLRGHAAGDQYMSTVLCTLSGGCTLAARALTQNNVLVRNNYDEGGTDFSADPPVGADDYVARAAQDNVDATSGVGTAVRQGDVVNVYFSASSESPSLPLLSPPGQASGANIFFNPDPASGPGATQLYAAYTDLGLTVADDINAMIVVDGNGDGLFNDLDLVLFSLTPSSPSLGTLPGGGADGGAADVFIVGAGTGPTLFVSAADLGMGDPGDNVDALDFWSCDDAEACAPLHGIRGPIVPTVSEWGMITMVVLLLVVGSVLFGKAKRQAA